MRTRWNIWCHIKGVRALRAESYTFQESCQTADVRRVLVEVSSCNMTIAQQEAVLDSANIKTHYFSHWFDPRETRGTWGRSGLRCWSDTWQLDPELDPFRLDCKSAALYLQDHLHHGLIGINYSQIAYVHNPLSPTSLKDEHFLESIRQRRGARDTHWQGCDLIG